MFLRFTTLQTDKESHALRGVFQEAFELRESGLLAEHEEIEINEALNWLKMHLKSPACLRESHNFRALSWFKPTAHKPMQYVWRIVHLLEEHNRRIQVHKTKDPGIIIYEDGWQVVAKPRKNKAKQDTPSPIKRSTDFTDNTDSLSVVPLFL